MCQHVARPGHPRTGLTALRVSLEDGAGMARTASSILTRRWYDPDARRDDGMQASLAALRRSRRREPKPKPEKHCKRCEIAITVGDHKIFCEECRVQQKRDVSLARYYRVKAQSRCQSCKAPVVSSVLCEACKARERAKPTTDRELRMMKLESEDVARGSAGARPLHLL